jgi:NAD-dependent dihydropyrimidine dehydrogenase PreA subunit
MYLVNEDECTRCGICVDNCPVAAVSIQGRTAIIDQEKCTGCGSCYEVCPQRAVYQWEEGPSPFMQAGLARKQPSSLAPAGSIKSTPLSRKERFSTFAALVPYVVRLLARLAGSPSHRNRAPSRFMGKGVQGGGPGDTYFKELRSRPTRRHRHRGSS